MENWEMMDLDFEIMFYNEDVFYTSLNLNLALTIFKLPKPQNLGFISHINHVV